jgi:hypothetical protein
MTRFSSIYQRTAAITQLRLHGEPVGYKRTGQHEWHSYVAIVLRREEEIIREVGNIVGPQAAVVYLLSSDDSDKGIMPDEVNTDDDKVRFAWIRGGELREMQVLRTLESQNGFTRLVVQ